MATVDPYSPVRKIRANSRSVTGTVPNMGAFESSLERDMMELLRFDPNIERVSPQPTKIEYVKPDGQPGTYTPDGLIHFKTEFQMLPILYEVKYRQDFRKDWKSLIPKFRAAKSFCLEKGWRFCVFTEREIRTPYLENVKFLWPYRERSVSQEMKEWVLQILSDLEESDPELLLCALCRDSNNRAMLLPVIWNLLSSGAIGCDLDNPLTMRSRIWAKELM